MGRGRGGHCSSTPPRLLTTDRRTRRDGRLFASIAAPANGGEGIIGFGDELHQPVAANRLLRATQKSAHMPPPRLLTRRLHTASSALKNENNTNTPSFRPQLASGTPLPNTTATSLNPHQHQHLRWQLFAQGTASSSMKNMASYVPKVPSSAAQQSGTAAEQRLNRRYMMKDMLGNWDGGNWDETPNWDESFQVSRKCRTLGAGDNIHP